MPVHGYNSKGGAVLTKEKEITAPPPSITKMDAEYSNWKILLHSLTIYFTCLYTKSNPSTSTNPKAGVASVETVTITASSSPDKIKVRANNTPQIGDIAIKIFFICYLPSFSLFTFTFINH